jgi:hypothetical protein
MPYTTFDNISVGTPSAQEILLNVQDDLIDNSGVYAIESPPFISSATHSAKQ